ncbi:cupin domain-containing protein [Pasteurella canis]|uniref:ribosomal protein uL16 3-hydroxylase n=1 Tax=Pasteurella canis TaxID=753 RepID=UPI001D0FB9D3|nr:cupin domain-containing protein [Pasteurella canis]UDW82877.1 cupin domain-containing protein [Pasteurella canis]
MKFCLPENITSAIFLRDYWQKKPLLIRNGLPQIVNMFQPEDIIELAQQEDVTARLIKQFSDNDWQVKCSPLNTNDFKGLPEKWSVLVQNLEQWSTELGELWGAFGFIPQWQRDDIMVSYAPKGGSVGKHYDEYDVFLVQGYGHRRWQLGKWCDPSTEFKANQPIRIFDDMGELILDEVLAPGDVLYVPSRLSHYGVAENDCLTFSFGLRYPNMADLLENVNKVICQALPDIATTELHIPLRLTPAEQETGKLDSVMVRTMKQQFLDRLAESEQFEHLFEHAVATTVSSRRYDLLETEEYCDLDEVRSLLEENSTIVQDNNCKLVYLENPLRLYANGEWLDELNEIEAQVLKQLANGKRVDFAYLTSLCSQTEEPETALDLFIDSLCNWIDDGWVLLESL